MRKVKVLILFVALMSILLGSLTTASAQEVKPSSDHKPTAIWSRGVKTKDILPASQYVKILVNGTRVVLSQSPFNGHNIIDRATVQQRVYGGKIRPNDWRSGNYYYAFDYYNQTSSEFDPYHYYVGQTTETNTTNETITINYTQGESVTSSWAVSNQISTTASLSSSWLANLSTSIGQNITESATTQAGFTSGAGSSLPIPPGQTGLIQAYLGGGYAAGNAVFDEYVWTYDAASQSYYWAPTGNQVSVSVSGWAPAENTYAFSSSLS